MNRKEAKELLPIIQAFVEGKTIEQRCAESWVEIDEDSDFHFPANSYRIKPEPKYCPFKNKDECWEEMLKHQPFGWVKYKNEGSYTLYENVSGKCDFEADFEDFIFADGTPFGIKE